MSLVIFIFILEKYCNICIALMRILMINGGIIANLRYYFLSKDLLFIIKFMKIKIVLTYPFYGTIKIPKDILQKDI